GGERHQAQGGGLFGQQMLAQRRLGGLQGVVVAPEAALQSGQAVGHRTPALVGVGQDQFGGGQVVVGVLEGALQHEGPVGGQDQLGQGAGEAAARGDQRHQ